MDFLPGENRGSLICSRESTLLYPHLGRGFGEEEMLQSIQEQKVCCRNPGSGKRCPLSQWVSWWVGEPIAPSPPTRRQEAAQMSLGSRLSPVSSSCNPGGGVESTAAPVRGRFWRQKQEAVRGVGWEEGQSRAFRGG